MMRESSSVRLIWSLGRGPSTGGSGGLPRGFFPLASAFACRAASLASCSGWSISGAQSLARRAENKTAARGRPEGHRPNRTIALHARLVQRSRAASAHRSWPHQGRSAQHAREGDLFQPPRRAARSFFRKQAYRASGLNLIVAAIILWNTRYLAPAFAELARRGHDVSPELIRHVAPLGWQHIALTGDYSWNLAAPLAPDALRPLRNESSILAA